jgi:non-canonical (house-cleaning) NTP pyrophosphatase
MEETVAGALNRALGAFRSGADLGIGIESGLMESPLGYMNFSAAIICEQDTGIIGNYASPAGLRVLTTPNGASLALENGFHFGHSTAFSLPDEIITRMLNQNMELDEAVFDANLVNVSNIGKVEGGFLGVLTKGRISRTKYSTTALQMALISYENRGLFQKE